MIDAPGAFKQGGAAFHCQGCPLGDTGDVFLFGQVLYGEIKVFHDLEHDVAARVTGATEVFHISGRNYVVIERNIAKVLNFQEISVSPEKTGLSLVVQAYRFIFAVRRMLQEEINAAHRIPSPIRFSGIFRSCQPCAEHPGGHVV